MCKNKHYRFQKFSILFLFILFLSGCYNKTAPLETSVTLPEVHPKYDEATLIEFNNKITQDDTNRYEGLTIPKNPILTQPDKLPQLLFYDSEITIPYPEDGVKGLYVTADNIADPDFLDYIIKYLDDTELNSLVIDFKDDYGNIVPVLESENPLIQENIMNYVDFKPIMDRLEEHQIYPIARIVTFKDYLLSDAHPEYSFHDPTTGEIWQDDNGAQFTNPFLPEVWNYNVAIAIEAAKLGFKDIQFDYVRFPEGFDVFGSDLEYDIGGYSYFISEDPEEEGIERVAAINDFLSYASDELMPYGVDVSADVFGYTAIAGDAPDVRGIGQNFAKMAERVDVMSSMIYPSHWFPEFFGYVNPDLYPYEIINAYMDHEKQLLEQVANNVQTRPWLQDFTASYLPYGSYLDYGPNEVQVQINALFEHGIHEYLLWNALGEYTEGVDYAPDIEPLTQGQGLVE